MGIGADGGIKTLGTEDGARELRDAESVASV